MTVKELKRLDYLYKYCMKARSRGQLYKERLKELQQLTFKKLRQEGQQVKFRIALGCKR